MVSGQVPIQLMNAAVAAFGRRVIAERDPAIVAEDALAYIAAALPAERVELYVLRGNARTLELTRRFPAVLDPGPPPPLPFDAAPIAAEALARNGAVIRTEEQGYTAATAISCDEQRYVFVARSRQPFADAAREGLDTIAAMYAAATMRCNAEARLAEGESWLRMLIDQLPAMITTMDENLVFTSARGEALANAPLRSADLVGRTLAEVTSDDAAPVAFARQALAGIPSRFEFAWEGRTYENRMQPLRDADGQIAGVVNLGVDVTEYRLAIAALRESRDELRRLSAAMNTIQEDERRRIAREIHDDLGQRLTALRLDVGLLRGELRAGSLDDALERCADMVERVDETLDTARRLATELRPAVLDDLGFSAAVEQQVESFGRRTGVDVSLLIEPEEIDVEPSLATALYRVIQEALTNVARHAEATRVDVRVEKREGAIAAEIVDDGRGIDAAQLNDPSALGLIGIRERIYAFGGSVTIEPANGGTRVLVRVPDANPDRR